MPVFISKFLENRNFRVRLGSTLSDPFEQEMGVPQGSILSVTLFSLKINSLAKVLSKDVEGYLYVTHGEQKQKSHFPGFRPSFGGS